MVEADAERGGIDQVAQPRRGLCGFGRCPFGADCFASDLTVTRQLLGRTPTNNSKRYAVEEGLYRPFSKHR
jgi:hypothetical protein